MSWSVDTCHLVRKSTYHCSSHREQCCGTLEQKMLWSVMHVVWWWERLTTVALIQSGAVELKNGGCLVSVCMWPGEWKGLPLLLSWRAALQCSRMVNIWSVDACCLMRGKAYCCCSHQEQYHRAEEQWILWSVMHIVWWGEGLMTSTVTKSGAVLMNGGEGSL